MNSSIKRNALVVFVLTGCSQALGFGRELLWAYFQGSSSIIEAFQVAETIPLLFTQVLLGAVPLCLIPLLNKCTVEQGNKARLSLLSTARTFFLVITVAITVLIMLLSHFAVELVAPGLGEQARQLASRLVVILAPNVVFLSVASLYTASLNARELFVVPTMAGLCLNLFAIIALAVFRGAPYAVAVASCLGGAVLYAIVAVYNRCMLGPISFDKFDSHYLKTIVVSLGPVIIISSFVSINLMLDKTFASMAGQGAVAHLTYAYKVINLPIYLISMSVVRVLLPSLSRCIAEGERAEAAIVVRRILRLICQFGIPLAIAVWIVREPVVLLLFGRGSFSANDVSATSACLGGYSFGIPAMALSAFFLSIAYAELEYRMPLRIMAGQVIVCALLSYVLHPIVGVQGVAYANALAYSLTVVPWLLYLRNKQLL